VVWEFVSDPSNDPRWCPKVKSVEPTGEGRWLTVHKPVPLRPSMQMAVERLERQPPQGLTLREEDEASVFRVEYRLEASAVGTRFTQVSEFEWKKLPRVLHGLFAHGVRRDVRAQLRQLKRQLEG
jgi:carbon monoxide dehydrogenase subunit G